MKLQRVIVGEVTIYHKLKLYNSNAIVGSIKTCKKSMTKLCDRTQWQDSAMSPSLRASWPGVARCSLQSQTFARPFSFLLLVINHWRIGLQFNVTEFWLRSFNVTEFYQLLNCTLTSRSKSCINNIYFFVAFANSFQFTISPFYFLLFLFFIWFFSYLEDCRTSHYPQWEPPIDFRTRKVH